MGKKKLLLDEESNHKAPLFRKKTAPWIVQIKYTISWNKEQQSVARFFPSRFFWSLFFPHEITLALFFPSGNSKQLRWIEFPSGKNKASVISFGKKRLLKKSFVKKSCKLCCCLFPSILYFIRTIPGGAVFLPIKGALILQKNHRYIFGFQLLNPSFCSLISNLERRQHLL